MPTPDPKDWVFSSSNNRVFNPHSHGGEYATPEEWVDRGMDNLRAALSSSGR
jgi:hypothetical protein